MKNFLTILIFLNLLFSANLTYAAGAAVTYSGVEGQLTQYLCTPSGNPSNGDLYTCINKLYKFSLVIASVIAVFYIVVAGYVYMSAGGNQESVDKAKSIIESSITALVILFAGFILLKALNPDLIQFQSIQPASVIGTLPGGGALPVGTCAGANLNLCTGQTTDCTVSACNSYATAIQNVANHVSISGINMSSLLKAIMYNESSCNVKSISPANACGLMQLQPSTAARFKDSCNASSENITCDWLTNSANAEKSICMAAYYLKDLTSACGTSVRNLAAGYNGGSEACANSVTCEGEKSCDSGSMRRWECLYDGAKGSKDQCNTGFTETKNYATKVLYCYSN